MKFLHAHYGWLSVCALALALLLARDPLLQRVRDQATQQFNETEVARKKTEGDLRQLRDDVVTARKLSSEIDRAHAEEVLAPVDRLKTAITLEKEAADDKIVRFTYTLAPEESSVIETGGTKQKLATSAITLAGDAPDDIYIYTFLQHTQSLLPGRARMQQLKVKRVGSQIHSAGNVHFDAALEWLSNGSAQTVAGGP